MRCMTFIAALFLCFFWTSPASAQQLLANPNLDSDLSGWNVFGTTGGGTVVWDPSDEADSSTSGSASVLNRQDFGFFCTGLSQTGMPVVPGTEYRIGVSGRIPGFQADSGFVTIQFQYWSQGCSVFLGVIEGVPWIESRNVWERSEARVVAPPEADCSGFAVQVCKADDGGEFRAYFDSAVLYGPDVFLDGFESGDISRWSATFSRSSSRSDRVVGPR